MSRAKSDVPYQADAVGTAQRFLSIPPRHSTLRSNHQYRSRSLVSIHRRPDILLAPPATMAQFFAQPGAGHPQQNPYSQPAPSANLQFYQSSYGAPQGISGHSTPSYGFGGMPPPQASTIPGQRGQLTTGWLAAFGTGGYEDEQPLLEELGVNFGHIKGKVSCSGDLLKDEDGVLTEG